MPYRKKTYRNHLLRSMTAADFLLIEPRLDRVDLVAHVEIETPNIIVEDIFFVETGLASVVAKMMTGRDIEVGIIGYEGMTGWAIALSDTRSPHQTSILLAGSALRIKSSDLVAAMGQSATLRIFLTRFARAFGLQVSSTAWANSASTIEERLARCLLMVNDRVDGKSVHLTHQNLSRMLGVQRPGVTVALHLLEAKGLIKSSRSEIRLQNIPGLRQAANGGYGQAEADYARLISWIPA